jgi:penicillin-binding protein 2
VAIANGGILYRPKLVLEVTDGACKVVEEFKPEPLAKVPVNPEYLEVVRQGMRAGMLIGSEPGGTSYVGTSYTAEIPGVNVAGKTGTAEYGEAGPDGKLPTHGWFAAFAPLDEPEIALVVFVEKGGGAQDAAERAEDILRYYFRQPPQPEKKEGAN